MTTLTADFKELFLLNPDVVFLNHGSFGATPRPVFEAYQAWQRRLEWQPVRFLGQELPDLLKEARDALGAYLNADGDDLVFVPNATFGVNIVSRSLPLEPGDEVLTTDHEYGACDRAWRFACRRRGVHYRRQPISLPVQNSADIVEQFWQGVTDRTRVIYFSHISSPTALRFPTAAICARAREAGILTLVDGAHAPGQIPLNLTALDADFYTGNCHKWLCAPKGAGFLYARRAAQPLLEPLVVSWGWESEMPGPSPFLDHMQWLGTHDPAAYLSVPAAITFQAEHGWTAVRHTCHQLVRQAVGRICELTGLPPLYPDDGRFYQQMAAAPLPPITDLLALKNSLYDQYRVEIPLVAWNGRHLIRVSIQAYNSQDDVDALLAALTVLLPQFVA
jgi:isopenicillin-N epimerase